MPDPQLALSMKTTAELLGISLASAYAAARRGDIPSVKIGKRILVPRKALEEWLEAAVKRTQRSE